MGTSNHLQTEDKSGTEKIMKFTVFLFAALAVASAVESESFGKGIVPKESDTDLLHKLTKWLSFNLPIFAPIRTTPRPRPAATRPTTRRPTTARPTTARPMTTMAPTTTAAPAQEPAASSDEQAPVDPMNALAQLYQMEGLKDVLPPMSEILNRDPTKPDPLSKPVGEIADPFTLNLMKSILNYIQSKPPGAVNLDDPIDITSDGSSL